MKKSGRYSQILQVIWNDNIPYFVLFDGKNVSYQAIEGYIKFEISEQKYCTGIINLEKLENVPCKDQVVIDEGRVCINCNKKNEFKYCLYCKGKTCYNKNKNAISYCNDKHYVYLAFFPNDMIKVGTVHSRRKEVRLIEQGALYYVFLAECKSGKQARLLEDQIGKLAIKSRISNKHKIEHLIYPDDSYIQELLKRNINYIREYIDITPVSEIIINKKIIEKIREIRDEEVNIWKKKDIEGEVICVVGTIIIFKNNNNIYKFDLKKIYGNKI